MGTVEVVGRELRIEVPGAYYHLTSSGSNGEPIFFDDYDRRAFLSLLGRAARRYGWHVYAYCLMTTHYHLLLQAGEGGISAPMQLLNTGYSRRTNRRHGRSAHLFRNRFFSLLIERESHFYEGCRYVVLNPCRAGMVKRPEDWPWSSYRATAGLELAPPYLARDELLRHFGTRPKEALRNYLEFVSAGQVPVSDTVAAV